MNTSMDSLSIEIESVSKDSNAAIDVLIKKLDNLRASLENVIKTSENFSKLKNNIASVSSSTSSKSVPTKQSGFPSAKAAMTSVDVKGDLGDSRFAKLTSTIRTANTETQKFVLSNNDVLTMTKKTANGVDSYSASLKKLGDSSKDASGKVSLISKGLGKFDAALTGAVLYGVRKFASSLSDFVKQATDYEESLNLFTVTLGDNAEKAMKWVEKFSNALYLDPAGVMQYMGQFNSLTKGLGVGADKAYLMSKNLTQLTYDLASFKNLSIDTAFRKLQSAMSGEIEPLRNVGVALSQATLQELALSMGIQKRVADMSEAEKAQLRYIQILRSTGDWQTDMGRTLVTPANALRILKQQFTLLARAIGNVFIPIIMKIIPYVMVLTKALTALAQRIASFLGYKIADIDYSSISGGLGDIAGGVEDIGDNADKTAKKLNTMLAPFDKLNVVQNKTESAGKGSGLGDLGGGLDLPLDEYDALSNLSDKLSKQMEKAEKNIKKLLPWVKALGYAFLGWKIGKSIFSLFGWLTGTQLAGKGLPAIKALAGALGMSTGGLALVVVAVTGTILALIRVVPRLFKAFDTFVKTGSLKQASEHFTLLDKALVAVLWSMNPMFIAGPLLIKTFLELKKPITDTGNVLDKLGSSISDTSKKKLTPLVEQFDNLESKVLNLSLGDKIVSEKDVASVQKMLSTISESVINELDADRNKQLKNIRTLEKTLGADKTQELLTKTQSYYDSQTAIINTNSAKITAIMRNASEQNRALTKEETDEITRLRTEMYDTTIKAATENSDEYYKIMARLKDNTEKLSIEQGSAVIREALKTKKKTVEAAKEQYESTVGEALKMKDAGIITDTEYKKIRDAAKTTRDDTIKNAEDQFTEIDKTTRDKLGGTSKYIDKESGKIKSKWQVIWEGLKSTVSTKWKDMKDKTSQTLTKMKNSIAAEWGEVKKDAGKTWEDIKNTVSTKAESLKTNGSKKIENFKNDVSKWWGNIKSDTSTTWENIKSTVSTKVEDLKKNGNSKLEGLKNDISTKWSNIKSTTSSTWDSIKTTVGNKFNDIKNSARDKFQGVKDEITNKWNSAKSWLSSNIGGTDFWKNKFGGILSGAGNVLSQLTSKFTNWKGKLKMPHLEWKSGGVKATGALKKALTYLNLPTSLPTLKVNWYAQGGFPKDGEFFVANENGPEMIGKIGNRSAVANNDQIETSLTNALLTALNNYDFGGGKGPTTIYIGNKKVYEGYGDYVNSENDRYGTNTIRI